MSDDKKTTGNEESSSSSSPSNINSIVSSILGNDIPYVPPTDRTNLTRIDDDWNSKPFIPPSIDTNEE